MLTIERYRRTRFWGLYESGVLLCVTVYKKGAQTAKARIERGEPFPKPVCAPVAASPSRRRVRRAF